MDIIFSYVIFSEFDGLSLTFFQQMVFQLSDSGFHLLFLKAAPLSSFLLICFTIYDSKAFKKEKIYLNT